MFSLQRRNEFNRGIEYGTRQSPRAAVKFGQRRYPKRLERGHQSKVLRLESGRYEWP